MEVRSIPCPQCGQIIINPGVNSQNMYRCGGCGSEFAPATAPVPVVADTLEITADGAAPAATPPPPLPPLGKEPAAGNYGLLQILSWALVALAVVYGIWAIYTQVTSGIIRTRAARSNSSLGLLQVIIVGVGRILVAYLAVAVTARLETLDRLATWLAWRSGATQNPVPEPEGSSLPYILPWTVCGGLLVVSGVAMLSNGAAIDTPLPMMQVNWIFLILPGAIVFLLGLGCGELRRFFWRMEQLALTLPRRTRGAELGLELSGSRVEPALSDAPRFMRLAIPALVVLYGAIVIQILFYGRYIEIPGYVWLMLVAALIGIVGGTYTIYRLTLHWQEMLASWELASRSVASPYDPSFGRRSANAFARASWWIGVLFCLTMIIPILMLLQTPLWSVLLIALSAALLLFLAWLATLKRDFSRFVTATSAFGSKQDHASSLRNLGRCLIAAAALETLIGLVPLQRMVFVLYVGPQTILLILMISFLPALWWALTASDFDRAAANLQARQEQLEQ